MLLKAKILKMKFKELVTSSSLPLLDAQLILGFLLGFSSEEMIKQSNLEISKDTLKKFRRLEKKRLKNYPLAYLLGYKDFYDSNFIVNKQVLVPRPETEQIIDYIIDNIVGNSKETAFNFLDIGTGSGAIIVSLAKKIKNINKPVYQLAKFIACDISRPALQVAKKNIAKQGLSDAITLIKSDLLKKIPDDFLKSGTNRTLVISANLPYLSIQEWRQEPSIKREPKLALLSKNNGLKHYERLFKQLNNREVRNFILIGEINPQQAEHIEDLAKLYFNEIRYNSFFLNDYSGQTRLFIIKVKN